MRIAEAMEVHPQETRDQALVRHLWTALKEAGAIRHLAGLHVWLAPRFGVSHAAALDEAQAEAAVKQLGDWLRRHVRKAAG